MPQKKKSSRAAKIRELLKRQKRDAAAALLAPKVEFGPKLEPMMYDPAEDPGPVLPLEPTVKIDVKDEPVYTGGHFLQPEEEAEIKEEPMEEPGSSGQADGEQDPIGQKMFEPVEENEDDFRCNFCLKLFQEVGGPAFVAKMKIDFVLGLRKWGSPGKSPDCCEECKKMFDLFYDFKQSCLMALARPAELFVWAGKKGPSQFVALKPKVEKKAKPMRKRKIKDFQGPRVSFTQESLEPEAASGEPFPENMQQDINEETQCVICNEQFPNGLALRQHISKHHPTDEAKKSKKKPRKRRVSENGKTYCGRCRKYFSDKAVYLEHKPSCIEIHERTKLEKRRPPAFVCTQCPKAFTREIDLTYHMNMHNGVRTIPCRREGCTKMFFNPQVRQSHEKRCGEEIQEICSVCGAIFRTKSSLGVHLRTHGDPQFKCEICNKCFYTTTRLKKHAAVHSDERKFQCKVCGKRFKSHEANRVHQRIHTEEKPYICHICGQRFMYNCILKTHLEKGHDMVSAPPPAAEVFPPNPFIGFGF